MELYCLVGGQTDSLKRWEADLNAQFYPIFKDGKPKVIGKDQDGKDIVEHRRLLVAPIQLYKIAFNKEMLPKVLSAVAPNHEYIEERYPFIKNTIKMLRKFIGLKKAPKPTHINPFLQPNQVDKAVFVVPLGLKEDALNSEGEEMI